MTLFDTWVYAHEVASTIPEAEVFRTADGKYAVWIHTHLGGYWYAHSG